MNEKEPVCPNESRRSFLKKTTAITAVALTPAAAINAANNHWDEHIAAAIENVSLSVEINGAKQTMDIDPRTTLLDLLRENLHLTGTKKGCDHGQCGACTVLADGRRVNACLSLALSYDGAHVMTIEGLASRDIPHPMQAAFMEYDG